MPRKKFTVSLNDAKREDPNQAKTGIKACLDYLYDEAIKVDLRLTAHLIGVASECIDSERNTPEW